MILSSNLELLSNKMIAESGRGKELGDGTDLLELTEATADERDHFARLVHMLLMTLRVFIKEGKGETRRVHDRNEVFPITRIV
jgi:hypothetical protein